MTGARSARRRRRHLTGAPLAARVLVAALAIAGHHVGAVWAQQSRPNIVLASPFRVESPAQVALPVQVSPLSAIPPGCFIRLRGLPSTAALSNGHSIAPGAWAIPIAALTKLEIVVPEGASGRSELTITLVSGDGSVLAETTATLVVSERPAPATTTIAPTTAPAASMTLRGPPPSPPAQMQTAPLLSPDDRERAVRLVKKGDEQLSEGGIAQARLLYERAAEAGLAQGAMSMAATYDPVELQRLGTRGLKPDREAARRWYERARQLGAPEAEQRLRRLGAN